MNRSCISPPNQEILYLQEYVAIKVQASSLRGGIPKIPSVICLAQHMPSEMRYFSVSLIPTDLSNTIWP